jgi:colanic acid/amylovoran biosynthesis protein
MKTFLIAGHGGFYNRGCEAIVRATLSLLRQWFAPVRVVLGSFRPGPDRHAGLGRDVSVVGARVRRWSCAGALRKLARVSRARWSWKCEFVPLWRPLHQADAVLSVGGDNYTMDYGYPEYYLALNRLCREAGRPLVIWGASIGPFPPGPTSDEIIAELRRADLITARESLTVEYLARHGVVGNVRHTADPAFLLPPEPVDTSAFWPESEKVLGVNISPILGRYREDKSNLPVLKSSAELVQHAVDEFGMGVLLIPHVTGGPAYNDDHATMQDVMAALDCPGKVALMPSGYTAGETKYVISQCRFLVAARTHATIAGFSSLVPTCSIAYSQKARGINRDLFGHERYVVDARAATSDKLIGALRALIEDEEDVRRDLCAVMPEVMKRARANAAHLADLLAGRHPHAVQSVGNAFVDGPLPQKES